MTTTPQPGYVYEYTTGSGNRFMVTKVDEYGLSGVFTDGDATWLHRASFQYRLDNLQLKLIKILHNPTLRGDEIAEGGA